MAPLKLWILLGFSTFAVSSAFAVDPKVCDSVAKTFQEHETQLTCGEVSYVENLEFAQYRAMCFGCDPTRQFYGDDYNATGLAFSEATSRDASGAENAGPLAHLNRVPSSKALLAAVRPGIEGKKCRDNASYRTKNSTACADLISLADAFYGAPSDVFQQVVVTEEILRTANDQANNAVIKAIQTKKPEKYKRTCDLQNSLVAKKREAYNRELGVTKDQVWKNVLAEVAVKQGCLTHYIDVAPSIWCADNENASESVDKEKCRAKMASQPDALLAKFKIYAVVPQLTLPRADVAAGGIQSIDPKFLYGNSHLKSPENVSKPGRHVSGGKGQTSGSTSILGN